MAKRYSFEKWLAARDNVHPSRDGRCAQCGEADAVNGDEYCLPCLKYQYGFDEAEERMLDLMIGGAVRSVLEAEIPAERVLAAVHRAVEHDHYRELEAAYGVGRKAA